MNGNRLKIIKSDNENGTGEKRRKYLKGNFSDGGKHKT
jgi:hypothetical protein